MSTVSSKQLQCTAIAGAKQKEWFAELRQTVFAEGKPYAIIQADAPHDIFTVMGVPVVTNQWWAAVVAAKRMSGAYLDGMAELGFHEGLCRYCSMGLSTSLVDIGDPAPWGGLPKPAILCTRLTCDCTQRVFELWADATGAELVTLEAPGSNLLPANWWELSRTKWLQLSEPHRLDLMVAQLRELIGTLERLSGARFDEAEMRMHLERVNRQEMLFDEARKAIAKAPKCPVRITEQIPNVMAAQWHRGTQWALEHAERFRDEVLQRVEDGVAACPLESKRLMWIGAGLWHDTAFYEAFEEKYGAVFVWSMYLPFGPDWYIREGLEDPLKALASRIVTMNEVLHNAPYAPAWLVREAKENRIDGAVLLMPKGCRPAASGTLLIARALEEAGVPTLIFDADMVDPRHWDREASLAQIDVFLHDRVCL